ncbi:hypothetical protein N9Z83_02515 [Akkermansiaceae bacterium]|nr:hypothetical protein [Akkermansiaceae bacterium]
MNRRNQLLILTGVAGIAAAAGFLIGHKNQPEALSPWIEISTDSGNRFPLRTVMAQTTGREVIALDLTNPSHQSISEAILTEAIKVSKELSRAESPAHEKRRINEVSALFENALRLKIDALPDFTCQIPSTVQGKSQRSGYPDLRVEHLPSGTVAYLDPKLFEHDSMQSTLRTFYYEANRKNTKVTEDALHLLLGFPHDGNTTEWIFEIPKLVDLSRIDLKLKVEFSASNKDLYSAPGK